MLQQDERKVWPKTVTEPWTGKTFIFNIDEEEEKIRISKPYFLTRKLKQQAEERKILTPEKRDGEETGWMEAPPSFIRLLEFREAIFARQAVLTQWLYKGVGRAFAEGKRIIRTINEKQVRDVMVLCCDAVLAKEDTEGYQKHKQEDPFIMTDAFDIPHKRLTERDWVTFRTRSHCAALVRVTLGDTYEDIRAKEGALHEAYGIGMTS